MLFVKQTVVCYGNENTKKRFIIVQTCSLSLDTCYPIDELKSEMVASCRASAPRLSAFDGILGADALQLGTICSGIPAQAPRSNNHTQGRAITSSLHGWTIVKRFWYIRRASENQEVLTFFIVFSVEIFVRVSGNRSSRDLPISCSAFICRFLYARFFLQGCQCLLGCF
jgi:hypothetical protein